MGTEVEYDGKLLGNISYDHDRKFVFVAENLEALERLFSLKPSDIIEVGGSRMAYDCFRLRELRTVHAFYPNSDAYVLRNEKARMLDTTPMGR